MIVACDCTGLTLNIALVEAGKLLHSCTTTENRSIELLPGLLSGVFSGAAVSHDVIENLAVALGPGSFTGIRAGLSFMKGFSQARTLPLFGVDSLSARAALYASETGPCEIVAYLSANPREYFARYYRFDSATRCRELSEISVVDRSNLDAHFKALQTNSGGSAQQVDLDAEDLSTRSAYGVALACFCCSWPAAGHIKEIASEPHAQPIYVKAPNALTIDERAKAPR